MERTVQRVIQEIEKTPKILWYLSLGWVLLISWIAFGWHLGSTGLVDETEPLFAEAARQMTVTQDWITPYFNGETRFDKPPLVYWLMAIAYQTIGVNEWAARLPSALAALGLTVMGFYTLRRYGTLATPESPQKGHELGDRPFWASAWIGAALIALNPQTLVWARTGVSDMLLSGCIGSSLLAFFWGYAEPVGTKAKPRWYLAFYILSALAVLTKGPVGIVIPGLIIVAFLFYMGNWRTVLREMQVIKGGLLFLLIAVPWFGLVIQANGDAYINAFFGYHNLERFTSVVNRHSAPWFFYFLVVLLGFAPWSFHLPVAIARLRFWRRHDWQQQPRSTHLGIFALIWFATIFVFFTIAVTKLPSYVIPLLPAAAIMVGLFWSDQLVGGRSPRSVWITHAISVGFMALLAWATFYSPNWLGDDPAMPDLPEAVRQSRIHLWGAIVWGMGAIAGLLSLLRTQGRWIWLANLLALTGFIIFTVMPANFLMDAQRQLPLRELAATILRQQQPNEEIIMVGFKKPTLVFYTQEPITYITNPKQVSRYLNKVARLPASVLVVGHPDEIQDMAISSTQIQVLDQQQPYELVRVIQPN